MSPRKPAPNWKRPEYPNLSLASAEDVPCFAASVWWISERIPLTSAAPEQSQKLTAHRRGLSSNWTENRVKPGRGNHSFFHSYCTVSFLLHRLEVVQSYAPLTPEQNAHTTVSVTQPSGSNRRARSAAVPLRAGTYRR
jgi:hypothetical protein